MTMDSHTSLTGLARLSGLLVSEDDPITVVTYGLEEARVSVAADAGGVLVVTASGGLETLTATSHRAADLEAYQTGSQAGPCVESVRQGEPVTVHSPADAEARWPGFGDKMEAAGYERGYAVPMRWHGEGIGGLNLFWRGAGELEEADEINLQTFADILTLAVVHVSPVSMTEALDRLRAALTARSAIEQAKGVLAYQRDLDMEAAYDALLELARTRGTSLAEAVQAVLGSARRGDPL
jgi:GAF domain-containing protein